mgnify:CR=1 FL=1
MYTTLKVCVILFSEGDGQQNRRQSKYRCPAPMVLNGHRKKVWSSICYLWMYIMCQITNVGVMIGNLVLDGLRLGNLHRAVRCNFLTSCNSGQLRRKWLLMSSCETQFGHDGSSTNRILTRWERNGPWYVLSICQLIVMFSSMRSKTTGWFIGVWDYGLCRDTHEYVKH